MVQSQVKPSHCCRQTPWLAQDSSVQVVLGPGRGGTKEHPPLSQAPSLPRRCGSFKPDRRSGSQPCQTRRAKS